MARIYDKTDLLWTNRGDLFIGNHDLQDTNFDPLRSMIQEVKTRLESSQGDWTMSSSVGSDLGDFVGELNNKETAEQIKVRIRGALARDGFINNNDMNVLYMPIDKDKLLLRITFSVAPTASNGNSTSLTKTFLYNYSDNNIYSVGA